MMLHGYQFIVLLFFLQPSFGWTFDINVLLGYLPILSTSTTQVPTAISVVLASTQTSITNTVTETVTAASGKEEGARAAATTRITTDVVTVPNGHMALGLGPQTALIYNLTGFYMTLLSLPEHCFHRISVPADLEGLPRWVQFGDRHRCWYPYSQVDIQAAIWETYLADHPCSRRTILDDIVWGKTGMTFSGEGGLVEMWDKM